MFSIPNLRSSDPASLPLAGGKGANLIRLAQAGFPVPEAYLITTPAYQAFVSCNHLEECILALLDNVEPGNSESLEQASCKIRALFSTGKIPPDIEHEILIGYQGLGEKCVAVRSSATAEDLPDMSFAGQQDTFLNVLGADDLLQAVVSCWSSLWTARAIGYRYHNQVPQEGVALAVIVQEMIESHASGVLFTANPLSGLRTETVIDATLGLGEALVSGQVDPDHYVVNSNQGTIVSKTLGAKTISIHGQAEGGTRTVEQPRGKIQALPDEQIINLARLGEEVEKLYGFPQDVEWAWSGGRLYLLQSRPITSLFPLPEGVPPEPLKLFFSFAAVQGIFDPITPLGRDALCQLFASGAGLFGYRVSRDSQAVLFTAGERLWVNFTPIARNSVGRRIIPFVLTQVEPTIGQAIERIWDDPRLIPEQAGIRLSTVWRIARFALPMGLNVLLNLAAPQKRRRMIIQHGERLLEKLEIHCADIEGDRFARLSQLANLLPEITEGHLKRLLILFISGVASGMASWNILFRLAENAAPNPSPETRAESKNLVLQVTRGMPYNPTTEMDLDLWEIAKRLQGDPPSLQAFQDCAPAELAARFKSDDLPIVAWHAIGRFLEKYGGRGLAEIDLGRTRWEEDPTHVFEMLSSFMQIRDEAQAPDKVFTRGASSAQDAINQLIHLIRKTHGGWLKAYLARFFAGRARQLMGVRENPKFFAVRLFWIVRRELLKAGVEFVQAGELRRSDDLFFLTLSELKDFANRVQKDWDDLIASRRDTYQREKLRRQIPRLLVSDGRAFYEGMSTSGADARTIYGSPVSPGSVQGRVRVVLDPRQAGLLPGEILVCPGTDPSWTPLFLSAAGLIMETGGLMTHGAVVAREYGIPAIVGVDRATQRLQTGQLIMVDGSNGQVRLLERDGMDEAN